LKSLLESYGIEVITLDQLAAWLGGSETLAEAKHPLGEELFGETRIWAAALALGGEQADEAAAHGLRIALNLNVSPWLTDQVLKQATESDRQHYLINTLIHSEPPDAEGIPNKRSLLARALLWWDRRYQEAAELKQAQENPLLPWRDSLAGRR
jgi:hypothetical protein